MLGAIIGDKAGSKYEFNNTFDYNFEMFSDGCDFTDDTICLQSSMMKCKLIRKRMIS